MIKTAPKSPTRQSPDTTRPRIVAVDDEQDFRYMLRHWLEPRYDLVLLPHGEELIDTIDLMQPDILILDIGLPGPDGIKLARLLRQRPRSAALPILFLTGRQDDDAFLGAVGVEGSAFLTKPVDREELIRRIDELLEG